MNYDRLVSIISLGIGVGGIALSIYLARPTSDVQLLAVSGWGSAAFLTFLLGWRGLSTVERLERALSDARDETIRAKNDAIELAKDLSTYRDIATALTGVINPEPIRENIRKKLAAYSDQQGESGEQDE
ncbi:hypothetical protein PI93_005555 [Pandoraea fibrosis]|uniref:Holin n=1 Tax=Pandoraea fibrosis TaxID=1891094 RepID=A0ABX6HMR6_9BURK|nr:hypothetical protein [Pandoraea fibrosis]QHE94260.1 hypothetical protein PJ20_022440 [Pandoraea fibrosis]QHF12176.1 hypothetical protein PI93_005555 [Pandoraea fibrosis]